MAKNRNVSVYQDIYVGKLNSLNEKEREDYELTYLAGLLVQIFMDQKDDEVKKHLREDI